MKIAQVAPLHESVPPRTYGGTERVVALLTDSLVQAGYDVTLYASEDSETGARLRPGFMKSLRTCAPTVDPVAAHIWMFEQVIREADGFDLIHFHTDILHLPFIRRLRVPFLTTLHGRLDLEHLGPLYEEYRDGPLVSISRSQLSQLPNAPWATTIYHGIGKHELSLSHPRDGYVAFLGRMSPEKRPHKAIEIASRAGMRIVLAAKVDPVDKDYYETVVRPLLSSPGVEYIGEVDRRGKAQLLEGATALLFPIDWPEPFGLVMIEAMACGTPVIAWRRGAVPEVVDEGVTGYIVETDDQAIAALDRCAHFDRRRCRDRFEERFLVERMMSDYVRFYEHLRNLPVPEAAA